MVYHHSTHQSTFLHFFYTNKCRALQDSADRLKSSFENLGPEGGYLSTEKARDVLVRTGLEKDQLRQIWNLSDVSIVCRCDLIFQYFDNYVLVLIDHILALFPTD